MKTTKIVVTDYIEPDLEWEREQLATSAVTFEAYQLKFAPLQDLLARIGAGGEGAERARMLRLACRRKFTRQQESLEVSVKKGQWDFSAVGAIRRFSGTKAGIVGCGRIGSLVIQMDRGFGVES